MSGTSLPPPTTPSDRATSCATRSPTSTRPCARSATIGMAVGLLSATLRLQHRAGVADDAPRLAGQQHQGPHRGAGAGRRPRRHGRRRGPRRPRGPSRPSSPRSGWTNGAVHGDIALHEHRRCRARREPPPRWPDSGRGTTAASSPPWSRSSTRAWTSSASTAPASWSPTSRTCSATSRPATVPGRLLETDRGRGRARARAPRPSSGRAWSPRTTSRRSTERWPVLASAMAGAARTRGARHAGAHRRRAGRDARRLPRAPHEWDESEVAALARYAEVIATTLTAAVQAHTAGELARQLQYALDYRVVIERAVGLPDGQGVDSTPSRRSTRCAPRRGAAAPRSATSPSTSSSTGALPA